MKGNPIENDGSGDATEIIAAFDFSSDGAKFIIADLSQENALMPVDAFKVTSLQEWR